MDRFNIRVAAVAISLAISTGAMAQGMSEDQFNASKRRSTAEYESAKVACADLSGNARKICLTDASGKREVAAAELRSRFKPSDDASYKLRVAKADADYALATQRCDDTAGNVKDVCQKVARASEVTALADAKVQLKTAQANLAAQEEIGKAQSVASEKGVEARKEATTEKTNANYAVAKEKCEAFAGDAKSACVKEALISFSKPIE